jgi:hypothetical protein
MVQKCSTLSNPVDDGRATSTSGDPHLCKQHTHKELRHRGLRMRSEDEVQVGWRLLVGADSFEWLLGVDQKARQFGLGRGHFKLLFSEDRH